MASESGTGTDLCGLNDDVLHEIAEYLSIEDIVNLSEAFQSSRFMFLLPTELNLEGPDFDVFGSRWEDGIKTEVYITSLPMFSGVKKITMSFDWMAGGFSLAVWIEVVREGQVVANSKPEEFLFYGDPEKKKENRILVLEDKDSFVKSIKKGDVLRFKTQIQSTPVNVFNMSFFNQCMEIYNFKCNLELDYNF